MRGPAGDLRHARRGAARHRLIKDVRAPTFGWNPFGGRDHGVQAPQQRGDLSQARGYGRADEARHGRALRGARPRHEFLPDARGAAQGRAVPRRRQLLEVGPARPGARGVRPPVPSGDGPDGAGAAGVPLQARPARGPPDAPGRDRGVPAGRERRRVHARRPAGDGPRPRGDRAGGGGAPGGDLLRAAGVHADRAAPGGGHRRRVHGTGVDRRLQGAAGRAAARDHASAQGVRQRSGAVRGGAGGGLDLRAAGGGDPARPVRRRGGRRRALRPDELVLRGEPRELRALRRRAGARGLSDRGHLGDGDDGGGLPSGAAALRPVQGGRPAPDLRSDRPGDRGLPAHGAGRAAGGPPDRAGPAGADHVGGRDPAGPAAAPGRRTGCRSRTGACARGCSTRRCRRTACSRTGWSSPPRSGSREPWREIRMARGSRAGGGAATSP